jgi:hypothetical protein
LAFEAQMPEVELALSDAITPAIVTAAGLKALKPSIGWMMSS